MLPFSLESRSISQFAFASSIAVSAGLFRASQLSSLRVRTEIMSWLGRQNMDANSLSRDTAPVASSTERFPKLCRT